MTPDLTLEHLDASQAQDRLDQLVDLYNQVYASTGDEFFGEDRYRRQLAGHMAAPGWELVAAHTDHEMAGYIYGFTLPETTRWWSGPGPTYAYVSAEHGRRASGPSDRSWPQARPPARRRCRRAAPTSYGDLTAGVRAALT